AFKADCERYFGSSCLYDLLGISKGAECSNGQLKAAYYKAALRYHPDRCGSDDKQVATAKFQLISRAFSILSDNEKRDLYDRTGSLDDDELYEDPNWFSAWGRMFNVVTVDSIEAFMKRYQGSDEEIADVKKAYVTSKGDMDEIMQSVMFAECDQEARIRAIIDKLIEDKEVKPYKIYVNEPPSKAKKRLAKWKRERKMYENSLESTGSAGSLVEIIKGRQASRLGFVEKLEEKYAKKNKAGPSKDSNRQKSEKSSQLPEAAMEKQSAVKRKRIRGTANSERELDGEAPEKISKKGQAKEKSVDKEKVGKRNDGTSKAAKEGNIPEQSIPKKKVSRQRGKANDRVEHRGDTEPSVKKGKGIKGKGKAIEVAEDGNDRTKDKTDIKQKSSASESVEDGRDDEQKNLPTFSRVRKHTLRMKKTQSNGEINTEKSSHEDAELPKLASSEAPNQSSVAGRGRKKAVKTEEQ
ncbi:hypothetical protein M514_17916, partial [Trichuris suis]